MGVQDEWSSRRKLRTEPGLQAGWHAFASAALHRKNLDTIEEFELGVDRGQRVIAGWLAERAPVFCAARFWGETILGGGC